MKTMIFSMIAGFLIGLGIGTDYSAQDIAVQNVYTAAPAKPLVFVKEIEIPGTDSLGNFNPRKTFSSKKMDEPITDFEHSDSYDYLFFNNAKEVPVDQPSLHLLIYRTTGNTGDEEIDAVMTRAAPLSEIEYSRALMFLLKNKPEEIKDCSAFIVGKEDEYVNLSACWNTIVENGWLLVGNTNMSHGAGLLVFLRKK